MECGEARVQGDRYILTRTLSPLLAPHNLQLLHLVAQGFGGDFELAGGLGLVAAVVSKCLADDFFFVLG